MGDEQPHDGFGRWPSDAEVWDRVRAAMLDRLAGSQAPLSVAELRVEPPTLKEKLGRAFIVAGAAFVLLALFRTKYRINRERNSK